MKYSLSFKKSMVKKVLPPERRAISAVAKEAGGRGMLHFPESLGSLRTLQR